MGITLLLSLTTSLWLPFSVPRKEYQRWQQQGAVLLSAYRYEIEFRPTGAHANADGLSRLPLTNISPEDTTSDTKIFNVSQMEALPVTTRQLRVATCTDSVLHKVFRYTQDSWPRKVSHDLQPYFNHRNELTVEEGCLMWGIRVVIPQKLKSKLLQELHRDHPGVTRMKSVARSYMWWPGLDKEVEQLAKACQACQAVKKHLRQHLCTPGFGRPSHGREYIWISLDHSRIPCF